MSKGSAAVRLATKNYVRSRDNGATDRERQIYAFSRAHGRLMRAIDEPDQMDRYYEALIINQKLWGVVQMSAIDDQFNISDQLRKDLTALHRYVETMTFKALSQETPDCTILVELAELNKRILLGLQGTGPTDEEMAELQAAEQAGHRQSEKPR